MISYRHLAPALMLSTAVTLAAPAPPMILEPAPSAVAASEALDWAFVFASSLHADRKDMGKAQHSVTLEYADLGLLALAEERADLVHGWRRGAAYAEISSRLAAEGRPDDARRLVGKAESFATTVSGWERKRLDAHVAEALARLGEVERTRAIATDLAANDPRQYSGRSAAAAASAWASRGDFDKALEPLRALDDAQDFDIAWWRTVGYLELSRQKRLTAEQRVTAAEGARRSVEGISGWKRIEGLLDLADAWTDLGRKSEAAEALEIARSLSVAADDALPVKPTLLARCASAGHRLGQADAARPLLEQAATLVPRQLALDRPAVWAVLGSAWAQVSEPVESARAFELAFSAANELENARPRALAMTSICVELARRGTPLEAATRARLRQTYAGLTDPW